MTNSVSTYSETVNSEKVALVVIDLQEGIARNNCKPHSSETVIKNSKKVIDAFTNKGAFVVFVKVSSIDGEDLLTPSTDLNLPKLSFKEDFNTIVPEIAETKGAYVMSKRQWGAFHGTDLDLQLRRRGINTIALCGISSSIGVDTTAREAYQNGYNQIFIEDAMSAFTEEEHAYVCKYIFPRLGKIRSTEQVVEALK